MSSIIRYNLGKINDVVKIYVSVIVDSEGFTAFKGKTSFKPSISKIKRNGGDYIEISVYPYVTIDFTSYNDKIEAYSNGVNVVNTNACKIQLNKYNLYLMSNMIKRMEMEFVKNKNLYYYSDKRLVLNNNLAKEISISANISDKLVIMQPTIIEVGGGQKEHEGIVLAFNDLSYFTTLTYTEMGYLRFMLDKIDLDVMAMEMIQMAGETKITTLKNNTIISIDNNQNSKSTIVKVEEPTNDSVNIIVEKAKDVMPNI